MSDVSEILKQLADEREAYTARIDAIESLRSLPKTERPPELLDALLRALTFTDPHVRRKVAEVLPDFAATPEEHARIFTALQAALSDPDQGVRRNIVRSLSHCKDTRVPEVLRALLPDPSPIVRRAVQEALGTLPEPPPVVRQEPATAPVAPIARPVRAPAPPNVSHVKPPALTPKPQAQALPPQPVRTSSQTAPEPLSEQPCKPADTRPASAPPASPTLATQSPPQSPRSIDAPRRPDAPRHDLLFRAWNATSSWSLVRWGAACVLFLYAVAAGVWLAAAQSPHEDGSSTTLALIPAVLLGWAAISFVGMAITRATALHLGSDAGTTGLRQDKPTVTSLMTFSLRRWTRAFLVPLPCVLLIAGAAAGSIFLAKATNSGELGAVLGGILYPVRLGLSTVAVAGLFFLLVGGPLWLPAVAVEDASLPNAHSRMLLFATRAPWTCLSYAVLTALRTALVPAFVLGLFFLAHGGGGFDFLSVLSLESLRIAWREPMTAKFATDFVVGVAQAGVLVLAGGYALTVLFAGATGTFLTVRARVAGIPPTELAS